MRGMNGSLTEGRSRPRWRREACSAETNRNAIAGHVNGGSPAWRKQERTADKWFSTEATFNWRPEPVGERDSAVSTYCTSAWSEGTTP